MSILQHPKGAAAPASAPQDDRGDHPLGLVPHQIRGFLYNFSNISVVGRRYNCCSACSDSVVHAYMMDGWDFVKRALNDNTYIEELSGLKEVWKSVPHFIACADVLQGPTDSRRNNRPNRLGRGI